MLYSPFCKAAGLKCIFLLLFLCQFAMFLSSCYALPNLAKGKKYSVSPQQNYHLSAKSTDSTSLTDGIYTTGRFWSQRTTVGWQTAKTVEFFLDLEIESNIESIAFNTARGVREAEVFYPAHIYAFVGRDKDQLSYVGDLAIDADNQPGSYHVKQFKLKNINIRARYVFLEIIPKGQYLFCDEIEVFGGNSGSVLSGIFSVPQARLFTDRLRLTGTGSLFNKDVSAISPVYNGKAESEQIVGNPALLLDPSNGLFEIESNLFALRRVALRSNTANKKLFIQVINPWDQLIPTTTLGDVEIVNVSFLLPKGGSDFKAFSINNITTGALEVSAFIDNMFPGVTLSVYEVPYVKTAAMEYVADPLVPAEKGFILRPGESRVVLVTAHGVKNGTWHHTLKIKSGDTVSSIPITTQILKLELPKKLLLNSVNWGYLDFKLIQDRQQAAVNDLLVHHTNVVVVPPAYLPIADSVNLQNLSGLQEYLNASKGATKVLLFADFGLPYRSSVNGKYPFMGDEWKAWFKTWFAELSKIVTNSGILRENLYFYPYDEMSDKQVDDFIAFAAWARKEIPDMRLYATLNNESAFSVLSYLDVAQIANIKGLLREAEKTKTELWLYDARGPAKSLSPYSYYRLMAWNAFARGYKGIGFWAYCDAGKGDNAGTAWNDFDGAYPDYAVIYEGKNNAIISSRRWEAWLMGIEDYELLMMYGHKKGVAAAKVLAREVLEKSDDTSLADLVRRQILNELSK